MPLDIATGILLALYLPPLFGEPVTPFFIALSIGVALLPDIDMAAYLLRPQKPHDHRSFTHYPVLYIPLVALAYMLWNPLYAALLAAGVYIHFIHDTIGLGWGIAWLWPLTPRRFRLLSPTGSATGGWEAYRSWLPAHERALAQAQHDPSWVRTYYLRPNAIGFVEYGALVVALVALYAFFA